MRSPSGMWPGPRRIASKPSDQRGLGRRAGEPPMLKQMEPDGPVRVAQDPQLLEDLSRKLDRAEPAGRNQPSIANGKGIDVARRTPVLRDQALQVSQFIARVGVVVQEDG